MQDILAAVIGSLVCQFSMHIGSSFLGLSIRLTNLSMLWPEMDLQQKLVRR